MITKTKDKIKILIVEHNPDDIELLLEELKVGRVNFISEVVKERKGYYNALTNFIPDIILSDYSLPSFHGEEAFSIREKMAPSTPFIFVSGSIGEEKSIEYIRNGVTDYVLKDKLFTLTVKVKRALEEAGERQEKKISQQQLVHNAALLERAQQLAHMGSWELSFTDNIFVLSWEACRIFGFSKAENKLPYARWSSLVHPADWDRIMQTFHESSATLKEATYNHRIVLHDGSTRDIYSESKFEMDADGNVNGMYGIIQDVTDRNKNESALRDAYNDKITILERIDDGFFAINENSIVTYWNKKAELLLNIKKEDMIGKNIHTVFSGSASNAFYKHYQEALLEKKTIHFREFSVLAEKWFEVSAYASDNGLSVYFKDVTVNKIADDKLKESELRYRSLNEQATDAICITDEAMRFIEVNPYGCETFGYTRDEALQLSLPDILFLEDLAENPLKVAGLQQGKTIRNERRLKRKDGTAINMDVSTRMMEDGRMIMFGHDITERKKAEALITESEKKYRQIVETCQEGVWLIDEENKTIFVNKKMCEILEYTEEEILGRTNLSFKDADEQKKALGQIERRKSGQGEIHEAKFITKTGRHIWTNVSTNPILKENGTYAGALAMMTDITDRKRVEQEMAWLINNTEESFILLDRKLEITSFNDRAQKLYLFYFGRELKKGCHILDYAQPQRVKKVKEIYEGVLEGSEETDEISMSSGGGETKIFTLKYKPAKDEQEAIIGAFISIIDITEKRKSEVQLIVNEKRYRALVENGADGIAILSPEGKPNYVSPTVEKILGYTEDEIIKLDMFSLIHPDDIPGIAKVWEDALVNPGIPIPGHAGRVLHKNGSWRWIDATITNMLHDPALNGIVDNFFDVTEKIELEKLREFDSVNLNALINNTTDLMWSVDRNFNLITSNQPFDEMCLINFGKIIPQGSNVLSVASAEMKEHFKQLYENAFAGEAFIQTDYLDYPFDLWTEISYNPIYKGDEIIGTACHSRDITERKKAEEKMISLTNRLLLATRSAGMGIWDWDIRNDTLLWDKTMYRLYSIDEMQVGSVYEEWLSRLHPEDKERVNQEIQMAITGEKEYDIEFRTMWSDLSVHHIKATGITESDAEGNIIRLIGVNWDITKQKEREQELKFLESVITYTTDSVVITEAEPFDEPGNKIVYVNGAFEKMTGYTKKEIVGKTPRILQGPKSDKEELNRFSSAIRNWQPCETTIINYKKNGEEFWSNFSVSPVANEKGWYTHWISIEKDVTERKLSEIRLNQLNEDLQKHTKELALSNAELEQFAYIASHDLQEPLRMITSFLSQLEKRYGYLLDQKGKTYIDFAVGGAKRMRQIILDLLDYSRVGHTEENKTDLDLNEVVSQIQILFQKTVEEKSAVIKVDSLPHLYGHRAPLHQVFQNLIGNALKYAVADKPSEIHISVLESVDQWQFAVADNGIGIAPEYFNKIFIIFQRLHSKDEYSGTGMGLAVTKKIIENLGGKIWVESAEGKGSIFYFTLKK